jgi:hypothetical protein
MMGGGVDIGVLTGAGVLEGVGEPTGVAVLVGPGEGDGGSVG